jgi:hypothetical protein
VYQLLQDVLAQPQGVVALLLQEQPQLKQHPSQRRHGRTLQSGQV